MKWLIGSIRSGSDKRQMTNSSLNAILKSKRVIAKQIHYERECREVSFQSRSVLVRAMKGASVSDGVGTACAQTNFGHRVFGHLL